MITTRSLFFSNASRSNDRWEGAYSPGTLDANEDLLLQHDFVKESMRLIRETTYISCWHRAEHESVAMWSLYGQLEGSVVIQTTIQKLVAALSGTSYQVAIADVKYVNYRKTVVPPNNVLDPFVHKRASFEYENEVRAIISSALNGETSLTPRHGIAVELSLEELIDAVYVSPDCPTWVFDSIRAACQLAGLDLQVLQSSLDESPELF